MEISASRSVGHAHRHQRKGTGNPDLRPPPGIRLASRGQPGLPPRSLRGSGPPVRLPERNPARDRPGPPPGPRRQHPPTVPPAPPPAGQQPRHHRRPQERHRARRPQHPPLPRHSQPGQRSRRGTERQEPLLRDPADPLQPEGHRPLPGPGAVHQRPPHPDLRAQEQPHQADSGGCG